MILRHGNQDYLRSPPKDKNGKIAKILWTFAPKMQSIRALILKFWTLKVQFSSICRSAMQNRREIKMAYITFAIVGIFFCFNLPRIVVGGYEVSKTWLILHCVASGAEYMPNLTFYRWDTVSRLLMVVNSSINFLIYCTGSEQFKVCIIRSSCMVTHIR